MGSEIWFRRNGGNWNANALADPASRTGGISINNTRSKRMFVGCQGSNTTITINFGSSAFTYTVPTGFTNGWPTVDGLGWSQLDTTKSFGSSGLPTLTNSNTTMVGTSSYCACASVDGHKEGSYYFEFTMTSQTLFSNFTGGGIVRYDWHTTPLRWSSGLNSSSDPNAGGLLVSSSQPAFNTNLIADGTVAISNIFGLTTGSIVSVAVILEAQNNPDLSISF